MDKNNITILAEAYSAAGLGNSWAGGFLSSVASKDGRVSGHGVNILNELLEKGAPQTWPEWSLIEKLQSAIKICVRSQEIEIMNDLLKTFYSGKQLTANQQKYAAILIEGATRPIEAVDDVEGFVLLAKGLRDKMHSMSPFYWDRMGGLQQKLVKLFRRVIDEGRVPEKQDEETLKHAFKGLFELWHSAPINFPVGSLCFVNGQGAVVVSERKFVKGEIVVPVLLNEKMQDIPVHKLKLPRKSRKKSEHTTVV